MKITPELLEKYSRDKCNSEEKKLVANWINVTEEIPANLSSKQLKAMKSDVWNKLSQKHTADKTYGGSKSTFSHLVPLVAAACLVLGVFFNLAIGLPNSTKSSSQINKVSEIKTDDFLYLSNEPESNFKIASPLCKINFLGIARFFNNSKVDKTVVCEGKSLVIPPGRVTYLINTKSGGFRKIAIEPGELMYYDPQIKRTLISIST